MAMPLAKSFAILRISQQLKYLSYPFSSIVSKNADTKVTHTGQKFDENDARLARFIDKEKYVNPHFAIDLINSIPPKVVKERVVSCDGGGGALGHPKVYINLDKDGPKACGYCGLRFVLDHHH
ncbi:NADH dehydrogenase [ubiquinone] iron-sulfur protein 6, mitochondrial-like [Argiope bruennichi]|uniref:NADH dehydrogenase [ubiquinone] iron-sulfur protein 6, mitochondrial n=1 Tax=Argiope bruennichi TaxID=94029 RepID=A0A8T0E5U7_ARGBR|nr:NADH dehydrogenase [ubiquinone] iron-sulfur protein 6, mitochondrial-like [Argiope bruennichi]KAF8766757.1 NADH dehydrogenase iron-sulfur like protein [Argiope bruennichi]